MKRAAEVEKELRMKELRVAYWEMHGRLPDAVYVHDAELVV